MEQEEREEEDDQEEREEREGQELREERKDMEQDEGPVLEEPGYGYGV